VELCPSCIHCISDQLLWFLFFICASSCLGPWLKVRKNAPTFCVPLLSHQVVTQCAHLLFQTAFHGWRALEVVCAHQVMQIEWMDKWFTPKWDGHQRIFHVRDRLWIFCTDTPAFVRPLNPPWHSYLKLEGSQFSFSLFVRMYVCWSRFCYTICGHIEEGSYDRRSKHALWHTPIIYIFIFHSGIVISYSALLILASPSQTIKKSSVVRFWCLGCQHNYL